VPSTTKKQQRFFGAEMGRAKKGEKTKTGMSQKKIKEFLVLKKKKKG